MHTDGHYAGPDLFEFLGSPSDPAFRLHHGIIDLVFSLWQAQNVSKRPNALSGGEYDIRHTPKPKRNNT